MAIQVIVQIPLLVLTTYLFLKNLKLSRFASIFGSLLFAFSGYVLVWLEYNSIVYTLVYFPAVLFLVDKIVEKPKIQYSLLIAVLLALQIFSGYPLSSIYTLIIASLYLIWRLWQNKKKFRTKFVLFAIGVVSGLLLAAVQIVPAVELSKLSIRKFDTTAIGANVKYLPFGKLASFFAPDYFGNPATVNIWGVGGYDNFAFSVATVGIFFFLLSLVTKIAFKKSNLIFTLFVFLALVWSTKNPLTLAFAGFSSASVNTRVLFVASFGVSVLAAISFDWIGKNKLKLWQQATPVVFYGLLVGLTLAGYFCFQKMKEALDVIDIWDPTMTENGRVGIVLLAQEFGEKMTNLNVAVRNLAVPSAIVFFTFFITFFKNKKILFVSTAILLGISVYISFNKYLSFTPPAWVFPETAVLSKFKKLSDGHRFEKEKAEILPQNTWSVYGLDSPSGQFVYTPLSTARYLNILNSKALKDEVLSRYNYVEDMKSPLIDTLDIEYFAALNRDIKESVPRKGGRPFPWIIPDDFEKVADIDTVRIYKNTNNLGASWIPKNVVCEKDLQKTAAALTAPDYNPAEVAYVNCDSSNTYRVFSRSVYPGWRAYVNGEEREIKTANISLAAVEVDEKDQQVEFVYQPKSVKYGGMVSGATLIGWIGALLLKRKKNED